MAEHENFKPMAKAMDNPMAQTLAKFLAMNEYARELLDGMGTSREVSLAKTKLDEASMWAVKHVAVQLGE